MSADCSDIQRELVQNIAQIQSNAQAAIRVAIEQARSSMSARINAWVALSDAPREALPVAAPRAEAPQRQPAPRRVPPPTNEADLKTARTSYELGKIWPIISNNMVNDMLLNHPSFDRVLVTAGVLDFPIGSAERHRSVRELKRFIHNYKARRRRGQIPFARLLEQYQDRLEVQLPEAPDAGPDAGPDAIGYDN